MPKTEVKFNASDVLGALALEANRIVSAANHFAAGATFPDADQIMAVIDRQQELCEVLVDFKRTMIAMDVERRANESVN